MYVAEEMAAIVVTNVEKAEGFESDFLTSSFDQPNKARSSRGDLRELQDDMVFPFCVSLGPMDGTEQERTTVVSFIPVSLGPMDGIRVGHRGHHPRHDTVLLI